MRSRRLALFVTSSGEVQQRRTSGGGGDEGKEDLLASMGSKRAHPAKKHGSKDGAKGGVT